MDFYKVLREAKRETFRLEMLDEYLVKEEDKEFEAWKRTGRFKPGKGGRQWERDMEALRANGVVTHRVHVVTVPLSEYLRFEIAAYCEDVKFIERDEYHGIKKPFEPREFWLIDDKHLFIVNYDPQGHFTGLDYITDEYEIGRYSAMKELLLSKGLQLDEVAKRAKRD